MSFFLVSSSISNFFFVFDAGAALLIFVPVARAVPHSTQNCAPCGMSALQFGHLGMPRPYSSFSAAPLGAKPRAMAPAWPAPAAAPRRRIARSSFGAGAGLRGAAGAGAEAYDAGGGIGLITGADGFLAGAGTVSSWLHFGQSTFLPAAVAGAASFFPHEQVTVILEGRGPAAGAPGIWRIFLQAGQRAVLPASFSGTLRTLPQLHVTCMGDPQNVREMQVAIFYETAPPLSTLLIRLFRWTRFRTPPRPRRTRRGRVRPSSCP